MMSFLNLHLECRCLKWIQFIYNLIIKWIYVCIFYDKTKQFKKWWVSTAICENWRMVCWFLSNMFYHCCQLVRKFSTTYRVEIVPEEKKLLFGKNIYCNVNVPCTLWVYYNISINKMAKVAILTKIMSRLKYCQNVLLRLSLYSTIDLCSVPQIAQLYPSGNTVLYLCWFDICACGQ